MNLFKQLFFSPSVMRSLPWVMTFRRQWSIAGESVEGLLESPRPHCSQHPGRRCNHGRHRKYYISSKHPSISHKRCPNFILYNACYAIGLHNWHRAVDLHCCQLTKLYSDESQKHQNQTLFRLVDKRVELKAVLECFKYSLRCKTRLRSAHCIIFLTDDNHVPLIRQNKVSGEW